MSRCTQNLSPRQCTHRKNAFKGYIKESAQEACQHGSTSSPLVHLTVQPFTTVTAFVQDMQGLQVCAGGSGLACSAALGAVLMQLTVKPL